MKKVVSFSWGRSSAYLVIKAIKEFGAENVDIVSMDTGAEHPKTYEFAKKMSSYILSKYGKSITCLRLKVNPELGKGNSYTVIGVNDLNPDLKPFADMLGKYGVPYIGGMFCTDRMKLTPFKKYCDETYGKNNYETWLGIRSDEVSRVLGKKLHKSISELGYDDGEILNIYKMDLNSLSNTLVIPEEDEIFHSIVDRRRQGVKYLAEISDFDKQDILDFWSEMPFDLGLDEWLGNCVFCPKKSNLKLAAAQRDEPGFYLKYLESLYSDSVRFDDNTGHHSKMYRGSQSLESLIATFDGSTGDEIKARIRGGKMIDTNSCSESCEVFS